MSGHEWIISIMAVFAAIGGIDRILGNRLGLGKAFEEGIGTVGSLALAMIGMICLAPVLSSVLLPIAAPVYRLFGADSAMLAGTTLACDMGGGALAQAMTGDPQAAGLGGVITGSMLGATLVFTVPVALGILRPEDHGFLARGVLAGIITVPLGIFVGGLAAGYPAGMVARNVLPTVALAVVIALGLWRWEQGMIRLFRWFGKGVVAVITLGLTAAIVEKLTGFALIPGMAPISEGFQTAGEIATVLAGAFPLITVLTALLKKPLAALGRLLHINGTAAAGLLATLANSIITFETVKHMDDRGKVVNIAFAVSAAFVFGDHLGFAAGFAPELLGAMIAGKLFGGVTAVAVALWMTKAPAPRKAY